jgi:hypothetical protein
MANIIILLLLISNFPLSLQTLSRIVSVCWTYYIIGEGYL